MARRAKKDDDYIGPSRGWAGLFHKFMMLLLFPLRKPLWFLLIVAVLFLAPTFRGVKPAEVHLWYWTHLKNLSFQASEHLADKTKQVMPAVENISKVVEAIAPKMNDGEQEQTALTTAKQEPRLISQPPRKVHRQVFERAEDISAQPVAKVAESVSQAEKAHHSKPTAKSAAKPRRLPNLRYLSVPEVVSGVPVVINANEIKIAERTMFLYGIFVQPASQKGLDGELYLRHLVENKIVECQINAYTHQNIATAICSFDGINLNRRMVDRGYSQNVALD